MEKIITKHVLEIRYEANPNFLDKRGIIAASLSPKIFTHWRISENKIELFNPDSQINAFFSYRNIGLSNIYPETTEEFILKSKEFIKASWNHFPTDKIQRIGVRSGFLCPKEVSFKKLFNSFNKNFVSQSFVENTNVFGAAKLVDIGFHFPPTDNKYKGIDSKILLRKVAELIHQKGFTIGNIDATIALQQPKINPYIPEMKNILSSIMEIEEEDISIKATTTEKLGFEGREEGVFAYAVVLIQKN